MGRVSQAEARANRERVVEAASRLMREKGIAEVGIIELMQSVGLTQGASTSSSPRSPRWSTRRSPRAWPTTSATWRPWTGMPRARGGLAVAGRVLPVRRAPRRPRQRLPRGGLRR
ncbi:hypothetical protein ACFQ51_47150 [Streptomyces kaempferi]